MQQDRRLKARKLFDEYTQKVLIGNLLKVCNQRKERLGQIIEAHVLLNVGWFCIALVQTINKV